MEVIDDDEVVGFLEVDLNAEVAIFEGNCYKCKATFFIYCVCFD